MISVLSYDHKPQLIVRPKLGREIGGIHVRILSYVRSFARNILDTSLSLLCQQTLACKLVLLTVMADNMFDNKGELCCL